MKSRRKALFFIVAVLLTGAFSFCSALEISYPSIGGKTIESGSSLTEFVAYFINLALVMGTVIAIGVAVYSGVGWVGSQGDVSKINENKKKLQAAIFGIVVLYGFFVLINYINPSILNITNIDVGDSSIISETSGVTSGVCLSYLNSDEETKYLCLSNDINSVTKDITGIEWKSSAEDLPEIYVYAAENYSGSLSKVANGGTLPFSPRSIKFGWKAEGLSLYDGTDFSINSIIPLNVSEDTTLLSQNFNKKVESIKIFNPSNGSYKYGAVLFPESSFSGDGCSFIMSDVKDLSVPVNSSENSPAIGKDSVSSIAVMKLSPSSSASVTFYNRANCQSDQNDPDDATKNICTVSGAFTFRDIGAACPDFVGHVISFSISDSVAVLLKTSSGAENGKCQLFRKEGNSDCVNAEKYGYIYNNDIDNPSYPLSFMLFPLYTEE